MDRGHSSGAVVRFTNVHYAAWAEDLVDFLNASIGFDAVFACKISTERRNWKSKGHGVVQFKREEFAIEAVELARKCKLKFEGKFLKAEFYNKEILRSPQISIRCKSLYMGCRTNENTLSVLWSSEKEVSLELDYKQGILVIVVDRIEENAKYELTWDLASLHLSGSDGENIKNQATNFLLLQVAHAPKIKRKRIERERKHIPDRYTFFWDDSEDHEYSWCRCTDFTENGSIGKASCYYSEVSAVDKNAYIELTKRFRDFHGFHIIENLSLQFGSLYSRSHGLLPILGCSNLNSLPSCIIFKIYNLVQSGIIAGPSLDHIDLAILDPSNVPLPCTQIVLDRLSLAQEPCYNFLEWFQGEIGLQRHQHSRNYVNNCLDEDLVLMQHLIVTPTRMYFSGSHVELSNRVIRNYVESADNFLRVHFTDEDMEGLYSEALVVRNDISKTVGKSECTEICSRILRILKEGIEVAGKKFEFLAFSSSQLREHSVWMFASNQNTRAENIRAWMGDFTTIRNVANCAARMGQCFSSSIRGPNVDADEIEEIPDIEIKVGNLKYCFSDGIGKISPTFAVQIACKCKHLMKGKVPSAFQIRYAGYKGVVAVNPTSSCKLSLRRSMRKFSSKLTSLDVLEWSRFFPCYLNRQIIILLSTLGIDDNVFETILEERISSLKEVLRDRIAALEMVQNSVSGEIHNVLVEMLLAGYAPGCEPFLSSMLRAFREAQIHHICKKSRIYIPKGRVLMGCLDESAKLAYGEVFIKISQINGTTSVIQGRVVVAKNPCLHPGDIRILVAVDSPDLQHMVDCIVFPQNGHRPHPNECSGSDLDGDLYFVTWDERLIPPDMEAPMDYHPPNPIVLDHSPTIEEIQTYFVDYMQNENLGTIANAHAVFADKEPEKARAWQCKELAELASISVDFPKTGVAALMPKYLRPYEYPDFMGKQDKNTYLSTTILGKLYRAAKSVAFGDASEMCFNGVSKFYDNDLIHEGFEDYLEQSLSYKKLYDSKLKRLMNFYGVKSEAEMITGFLSQLLPTVNNYMKLNHDSKKVEDKIHKEMLALQREAKAWFDNMVKNNICSRANDKYAIASAWYHVTYHPSFLQIAESCRNGEEIPLLSFPWVLHDELLYMKKNAGLEK